MYVYLTYVGSGSNDSECVLHTPQSSKTGASPPDAVYSHTQDISELEPHHQTQFTVIHRTSQNWSLTTRRSLLSYPGHLRTGASPPDAVYCHTQDISELEPHHQTQFTVIPRTSQNWSLTTRRSLLSYPGHLRTGASPSDAVYCHTQDISELEPHHQTQFTVILRTSQNWSLTTRRSLLSYPGHLRTGASPPDAVYCHTQDISELEPHHQTQFTVIPRTSQDWSLTTRRSLLSYTGHLRTGASPSDAVYCHTQDISELEPHHQTQFTVIPRTSQNWSLTAKCSLVSKTSDSRFSRKGASAPGVVFRNS